MTMSCKQIQYGTAQMATKEKGEKGGEGKQTMVALLVFIMATLEMLGGKGPFSGNVFKHPAKNILQAIRGFLT